MALKQCSLCDRKFTKLEHVKRHERSRTPQCVPDSMRSLLTTTADTRERPYECPTCKKHFSRR
jgi:uncharacterized Zn-finger protein